MLNSKHNIYVAFFLAKLKTPVRQELLEHSMPIKHNSLINPVSNAQYRPSPYR